MDARLPDRTAASIVAGAEGGERLLDGFRLGAAGVAPKREDGSASRSEAGATCCDDRERARVARPGHEPFEDRLLGPRVTEPREGDTRVPAERMRSTEPAERSPLERRAGRFQTQRSDELDGLLEVGAGVDRYCPRHHADERLLRRRLAPRGEKKRGS